MQDIAQAKYSEKVKQSVQFIVQDTMLFQQLIAIRDPCGLTALHSAARAMDAVLCSKILETDPDLANAASRKGHAINWLAIHCLADNPKTKVISSSVAVVVVVLVAVNSDAATTTTTTVCQ